MRTFGSEEEEKLNSTLNSFTGAVQDLKAVAGQIDEYNQSSSEESFEQVTKKAEMLAEKGEKKLSEIQKLQPELDRIGKAVEDHERHKKNLKENFDLISSGQRIEELEKEVAKLEEASSNVEGHETCYDDIESLTSRKQDVTSSIARLEGRRGEILESIRGLKVTNED
jgi:DNA repair exonuclease SbcCD ATPase subunit